jgi:hypothetical protein
MRENNFNQASFFQCSPFKGWLITELFSRAIRSELTGGWKDKPRNIWQFVFHSHHEHDFDGLILFCDYGSVGQKSIKNRPKRENPTHLRVVVIAAFRVKRIKVDE